MTRALLARVLLLSAALALAPARAGHAISGHALPDCRDLAFTGAPRLHPPDAPVGTARVTARLAVRAWQVLLSPGNGANCNFYPTCSGYALQAARRHGPVLGAVLAFERIARPHEGWRYTPCELDGRTYLYDPVEDNTLWLPKRAKERR